MEKICSFKQLKIWQKGIEIVKETYRITKSFPKEELYGLTSQMRRAATSIPTNIAEGFKRFHPKEYKQFLFVSLGSATELETEWIIAYELGFINQQTLDWFSENIDHLSRMTTVLMKKL